MGPFNICLSQHGIYISTSSTRQVPANDEFLKEAYRIVGIFRIMRSKF